MRTATGRRLFLQGAIPTLLALTLASLVAPRTALAYVDPVSGSVIFQIMLAGFLGAIFTIKSWWSRAVALIRSLASRFTPR